MQPLTCPIPGNINPLQSNGFMFAINKLPEVTYFCQEAVLPELDLPTASISNPLINYPIPGEKLTFGALTITFIIDEEMTNYKAVHDWMVGLGFPRQREQYRAFLNKDAMAITELSKGYSDASLQILNSANNAIRTITFRDVFPTNLSSIQLQSTADSTVYLAGSATFMYTMYEFT